MLFVILFFGKMEIMERKEKKKVFVRVCSCVRACACLRACLCVFARACVRVCGIRDAKKM